MPTNLPPEAAAAEERYRTAQTIPEKVRTLEEYLSLIPKHKGTDKLRADLRKRLSKLKESSQQQKGGSRQISAFHIDKEGAGQVHKDFLENLKSARVWAKTCTMARWSAGITFCTMGMW